MSSEIKPIGSSGSSPRVARETHLTAPHSEQANSLVTKRNTTVEQPKAVSRSFDPITSRQNVKEAVDLLNNQMASNQRGIGFTVNNDSSTPIVTVRNTSTGEVVRQIPNEVVIKLATGLDNSKGVIHNKQA